MYEYTELFIMEKIRNFLYIAAVIGVVILGAVIIANFCGVKIL